MTPFLPGGVSDGNWHTVHIHYYNKVGLRIILSVFSTIHILSFLSPFGPCFDIMKQTWADHFDSLKNTSVSLHRIGLYFGGMTCNGLIKTLSILLHLLFRPPQPLKHTCKSPLALKGLYGVFMAMLDVQGRRRCNIAALDV